MVNRKEVAMEKEKCNCTEHCTCGDDCTCTEDVKCAEDCHCGEHECKCDETCKCHEGEQECHCEHDDKKNDKKKKKEEKNKYKQIIEELKEELKKKDQDVLVAKADLINYRKRKDEEVVRMLKFCNEELIKQMLPIMDNFERAIKLDDDNLDDEVSKFLEGFKMIYCSMQNVMGSFEVKAIDGANKPFDPTYHNAIMLEQKEGVEPGMVIEVLQKGYIYKDKVIRPAMVKVSE
ncbi:MAG: nucleotide exchange factor GrpE [Firmicutes bacterium]|nr:nucleotide exchange factor GrpE [Bacillota bacterium]